MNYGWDNVFAPRLVQGRWASVEEVFRVGLGTGCQ